MERKPGRPHGSAVRQNIVEVIHHYGPMYGYELYKKYIEHYPSITLRLIYYHLKKGVVLKEFKVKEVKQNTGEYSWGGGTENIIYELGPDARALGKIKK